jgi:hypothetical protein
MDTRLSYNNLFINILQFGTRLALFNGMKQSIFLIIALILAASVRADKGHNNAKKANLGNFEVKLHGKMITDAPKDSVLVIFDRFDHTGAGVVYQEFYPDADHSIIIPALPAGKYYVTIQCLGLHRDRVETVINIKADRNATLKIDQQDIETFTKDNVYIPAYQPDPTNLGIVKNK